MSRPLINKLLALSPHIRYVAVYRDGTLTSAVREGLADASSPETDRYEELLVNPALVTLTRQRGDIDSGGMRYLLIRYGNFFQLVIPYGDGHVSVAIEPGPDPVSIAALVEGSLKEDAARGATPGRRSR